MSERALELIKQYAAEATLAGTAQATLQRVKCEYACKSVSPVYDSSFVCVEPGEEGRLACTFLTAEELASYDDGACESCKKYRTPAIKELRDMKKMMARTRKEIVRLGVSILVAERLRGDI